MRRSTLNYAVDLLTLLVILGMSWTGLVIRFVLPPGTGGRHGHGNGVWSLWSRTRHDWGDIHAWLAASLGVLLLLHVGLHWTWVCSITKRLVAGDKSGSNLPVRSRHAWGVGLLLVVGMLLGGGTWWSSTLVRKGLQPVKGAAVQEILPEDRTDKPADAHGADGEDWIRGSMSLRETATAMGMSVEDLSAKLSLPENVLPDERLGRLAREYGFTISEVRALGEQ